MSQPLREYLQSRLQPLLESRGFIADQPQPALLWRFRRRHQDQLHILEVQWDKYQRPRFILNYGTCPIGGLQVQGKHVAADQVSAGWTADAGRLHDSLSARENWFKQYSPWWRKLLGNTAEADHKVPVDRLMACLGELEIYWHSGLLGPHMWPQVRVSY